MTDIGDFSLSELFNLNNLLYLILFVGSISTAYWRLRKYLANKNKEYMREVAEDVKKTIIQSLTNDNIVTEMNFTQKMNEDAKKIKDEMDKRFETVNTCNKRIEEKLNSHERTLQGIDKKVDVHIAKSEEQSKSLDRVINVVNNALGIVKPVIESTTHTITDSTTTTENSSIKSD